MVGMGRHIMLALLGETIGYATDYTFCLKEPKGTVCATAVSKALRWHAGKPKRPSLLRALHPDMIVSEKTKRVLVRQSPVLPTLA